MKKILINFTTLARNGMDIPRLLKYRRLNSLGLELDLLSSKFIKKIEPAGKDVYTFNETIPELELLPEMKGTVANFMFFALKMNLKGLLLTRKILKGKYDVIYSPAAVLDLMIIPYFVKLFDRKIKWVTVLDNTVPLFSEKKIIAGNKMIRILAWLFFKISLQLLKKTDCIFVVKPELKTYLRKHNFPEGKIVITGNGIERDLIKKAKKNDALVSDAVFLGRLNEAKGIFDLLKVLSIVKKNYPDFLLAIIGDGDTATKRKFEKKISELNLSNNVQMHGFVIGQKKFDILKSSKCFLFLSETESLPVAPLEAVCLGLPAFVYNLDAFEMYRNNEVIISPKYDVRSVAEKVLDLFQKGNFENKNGPLLLEKYSWEKIAEIEYNAIKNL